MGLFWVVVIGAIVWAAVALLPGNRSADRGMQENARDILDRRFAEGQIDAEQYRRAREELGAAEAKR
jgi:putative membrane protein